MIATFEKISDKSIKKINTAFNENVLFIEKDCLNRYDTRSVDVLVCRDRDLTPDVIDKFDNLKMIFILSVGVEKLPWDYLKLKSIKVAHVGGEICSKQISEYVIGSMLSYSANLLISQNNRQKKHWQKFLTIDSLEGKNVLIVGYGDIGKEIANKCKLFNMYVMITSLREKDKDGCFDCWFEIERLEQEIEKADYVVCTVPLTKSTYRLFDSFLFSRMKETSVFINISRGNVVDEDDLIDALRNNKISGAVLDVFSREPLETNSPLWDFDNVILTPHTSGRINDFIDSAIDYFVLNYQAYKSNKMMPNSVNLERGY